MERLCETVLRPEFFREKVIERKEFEINEE